MASRLRGNGRWTSESKLYLAGPILLILFFTYVLLCQYGDNNFNGSTIQEDQRGRGDW